VSGSDLADRDGAHAQRTAAAAPAVSEDGTLVATGHGDVRALLSDPPSGCARVPAAAELGGGDAARGEPLRRTIASMAVLSDPPQHARVRRPLQRAFAPHVVAPWRPRIRELCSAQLDAAEAMRESDGAIDAVSAITAPLLGAVLDELVGLRAGSGAALRELWGYASASVEDPEAGLEPDAPLRLLDLHERLAALLAGARAETAGELPIHILARAAAADEHLSEHELICNLIFVLASGHRAGAQALALAIHTLACHPEQLAVLRAAPALVAGAVEELLRWDGPVQSTTRVAREDVDVGDVTLRAGDFAVLVLGAANRDPRAFARADRLDLTAHAPRHLSFGYGVHFCVGAALMRIVLQEAVSALVARAPGLALAGDPRPTAARRGFERLAVRW
jgi:cytochrome P450